MTLDEIKQLKRGDLLYFVREIDHPDRDWFFAIGIRRVLGVTEGRVTHERHERNLNGDRRITPLMRMQQYSLTEQEARIAEERQRDAAVKGASHTLVRAREALEKATAFRKAGET